MDVFGTAVTAGTLIAQFLSSCAAYSGEAKSLKAQFDWDLRALQTIADHFEQRRLQNQDSALSASDQELLERTGKYLEDLLDNAQLNVGKIRRKGWLHDVMIRTTWFSKRSDLKEMQQELHTWTQRFGIRVLGLPEELKTVIPNSDESSPPSLVQANRRLRSFLHLNSRERASRGQEMLLQDSTELETRITGRRDVSFLPLQNGNRQLIFAGRKVLRPNILGTPEFDKLQSKVTELAAALNCVDKSQDIRLLKVEYCFYHAASMQFLFAHVPPYPITSMVNLEDLIKLDPLPDAKVSLDQRLKLAHQLSEAVFYLHVAGFFHKNITPWSVVALQRDIHNEPGTSLLDSMFLMGFDLIRGADVKTTKEGAMREDNMITESIWDFEVFQHPDRLYGKESKTYRKQYDVYSLGVLFLEIGLWKPLSTVLPGLEAESPTTRTERLIALSESSLGPIMGERYQRVISWALSLEANVLLREEDFVEFVISPLGRIAFDEYEKEERPRKKTWTIGVHWGLQTLRHLAPEKVLEQLEKTQFNPHVSTKDTDRLPFIDGKTGEFLTEIKSSKFYRVCLL
ncbi:hypothetical protein FOBRF1_013724 [Fusarium oxysporum]